MSVYLVEIDDDGEVSEVEEITEQMQELSLGGPGSGPRKQSGVSRVANASVGAAAGLGAVKAAKASRGIFRMAKDMSQGVKHYMPPGDDLREAMKAQGGRSAARRGSVRAAIKGAKGLGAVAAVGAGGLGYLAQKRIRRAFAKDTALSLDIEENPLIADAVSRK